MLNLIIKCQSGRLINMHDIKEFIILPEVRTGDTEDDDIRCWRIDAIPLHKSILDDDDNAQGITVFEAAAFDNKEKYISRLQNASCYSPVKGDNYKKVSEVMAHLLDIHKEMMKNTTIIDFGEKHEDIAEES